MKYKNISGRTFIIAGLKIDNGKEIEDKKIPKAVKEKALNILNRAVELGYFEKIEKGNKKDNKGKE